MGAEIPELLGRKIVTSAVINPPIPPTITHGITADDAASGLATPKNLFQVNIAAATTSKSIRAVLLMVPFTVMAPEEAMLSRPNRFSVRTGLDVFVKFIISVIFYLLNRLSGSC